VWIQWASFALNWSLIPFSKPSKQNTTLTSLCPTSSHGSLATAGNPLRARLIEDYLRHVAQMFLAVGSQDPHLNSAGDIDFTLQRMVKAWKKEDPPPNRVKPVRIQVIRRIAFIAQNGNCPLQKANADIIILAFFFLLCPGEYTDTSTETLTKLRSVLATSNYLLEILA
jgi:hypothetical protein